MKWWTRLVLVCCDVLIAVAALVGPATRVVSDSVTADVGAARYDCTLALYPSRTIAAASEARLVVETGDGKSATVLRVTPALLTVESIAADGTVTRCGESPSRVKAGAPYRLTVLRRGACLGVQDGQDFLFRGAVANLPHARAEVTAGPEWGDAEAESQSPEPVAFADNFMRTENEPGAWKRESGAWVLQSAWDNDPKGGDGKFVNAVYAQNPFAWVGRQMGTGMARCTAGEAFWDDYTFTAAVCPPVGGAVGLLVNASDAHGALLVRWSPTGDRSPTGNRLALYRLTGKETILLAEDMGGYLPGQWYKLAVASRLDALSVAIDGRERLSIKNPTPSRGGIGLCVEGSDPARFDDITAYGRTLKTDLIAEHRLARYNERMAEENQEMSVWASAKSDWRWSPQASGARQHRLDFYGDQWMSLTMRPTGAGSGELHLLLRSQGNLTTGYRAVIRRAANAANPTYAIYRENDKLAETTGEPLNAGEEYGVRFILQGDRLCLEVDGERVAEAQGLAPVTGLRPLYRGQGAFNTVTDAVVLGSHVLDYAFTDAPTDWIGQGTWMPTTRWACTPQWSFLGGWSRGDAVLWHKQRFTGDQYFESYVATKMEYPRERETYVQRFRDYGLTICGDGHNPRSGYTLIYGAPDQYGRPNSRTVLLRNGEEVASTPMGCPGWGRGGHTQWYGLALQKRGAGITAFVNGYTALRYTDPAPLAGGVPAIWTTDNGITVARARLHFAEPPQPRTDPLVILDEPWYPEWANLGQPLTLDFSRAWASSGDAPALRVIPRQVPSTSPQTETRGQQVLFTPRAVAPHWFGVVAADGGVQSAPVEIALPVFNPGLTRDDARALVLYRFTEGTGNVVHDQSAIGPKADLAIPSGSHVRWLPGQGLAFNGVNHLIAEQHTDKLMRIAQTRACTIEAWVSLDTIFPPSEWLGYLLAWEKPGNPRQNFACMHGREGLYFQANSTIIQPMGLSGAPSSPDMASAAGVRTGLQHFAVTWDGTQTRCYVNGVPGMPKNIPWNLNGWAADAPLVLGSHLNQHKRRTREFAAFYQVREYVLEPLPYGPHGVLGAYYLVAIHDRCLPSAEVRRNYQAGPSAR